MQHIDACVVCVIYVIYVIYIIHAISMPVTLLYQTMILFAMYLPIATLAPFTLTIILPAISEMTVTSPPTTKPSFSRKDLTSYFPPIFLIICASPAPLIDNGIMFTSFHVFSS